MAVDLESPQAAPIVAGRRTRIGVNVLIAAVLAVGVVTLMQVIAFGSSQRWDWTSSGINSLSEGTENLLRNQDQHITLTSLYFETDLEEEDQQRYRRTVDDLLGLYESTNRSKITSDRVNPLSDLEDMKAIGARLRDKSEFKEEIGKYTARVEAYANDAGGFDVRMKTLVAQELELIRGLTGGSTGGPVGGLGGGSPNEAVAMIELSLTQWRDELDGVRRIIDTRINPADPQYTAASSELKGVYRKFGEQLKNITAYGKEQNVRNPNLPADVSAFLADCDSRYSELSDAMEAEKTKLDELEPLKLDNVLRELGPTDNAILVETENTALVVSFANVWPPLNEDSVGRQPRFRDRAFKGEEKVTAAILRATHQEQTALIFVRYGGMPLFIGGFMPGQPPAPYRSVKAQLEEVNFVVKEWDLKSSDTPPEFDPKPTRRIFIVLKPQPPQRGMMGQPSQDPPFTDRHKELILSALGGDDNRALFVGGWFPGPFGAIPATYEYGDYLRDTWGIDLDTSALIARFGTIAPGRYHVTQRDFFAHSDVEVGTHEIVRGPQSSWYFPWCAPLNLLDPPEGVSHHTLITQPAREGVWGVHQLQEYERQIQQRQYMTRLDSDLEGPFTLAVAATKGDAKVVVVSSRSFAEDAISFAKVMILGAQGLQMRSRNPGNITLLINSLHWLNDNTQFLNVGKPVDMSVLTIPDPSTVFTVRVLTMGVWPALALIGGASVWWVRRR